ncbi:MAG TPA: MarR family transcriptional regulator [Burkholderiaceae bacterium]|nr:MarR family transcriptional regulator [Burkholderiaceae bacterium]HMX10646.1 MarR family transcriptional regulator [Burkholderiaceae bacterium]HMY99378.1 MarR family transcriptional regulator [Burkholderiaceae bacterium]HNB47160.1 MarR family transcriptional regulator [Burkholderiaceae bacterium]HNG79962.1 MarR family transcriptional regulator [Burkholderiaceae bacterium]
MPAEATVTEPLEPSYDQSVSAVHNRLFFRLFQSGNTLDRQVLKEIGVTPVHWAVMGALSRPQVADGMSFSDLADYLFVSRQSLDGVLKRLERDGHAQRVTDTADRRVKLVVMTPEGRRAWNELQPRIYEFYRQALASFRFDDRVTLLHFLNRLNDGMRAVTLAEAPPAGESPVSHEPGTRRAKTARG